MVLTVLHNSIRENISPDHVTHPQACHTLSEYEPELHRVCLETAAEDAVQSGHQAQWEDHSWWHLLQDTDSQMDADTVEKGRKIPTENTNN